MSSRARHSAGGTASAYEHSTTFAVLKNIKERLTKNLTTSQYLQIYDEYLERAIKPIIESTSYFDSFVGRLLGWQEQNFRRKISFLRREELPNLVIAFLLQPTPAGRMNAYRRLRLDRGVRIEFVKIFAENLQVYQQACNVELLPPPYRKGTLRPAPDDEILLYNTMVKSSIENQMRVRHGHSLLSVLLESQEWLNRALNFKQIIMEKYVRLALSTAQKDYSDYFNCEVKLDDIIPTYLLAASRAIDKCDSRQGALTSHVQNWFKTGRSRVQQQAERGKRKVSLEDVHFSLSDTQTSSMASGLIARSHEQELEAQEEQDHQASVIRELARIVDPTGAARAYLGIEEILREDELALLSQPQPITSTIR